MTVTVTRVAAPHWLELAGVARERARRANTRAATTPYPNVAERYEWEAAFNLALARTWARFAERERG